MTGNEAQARLDATQAALDAGFDVVDGPPITAAQVRVIGDPRSINRVILSLQRDGARVITRSDRASRDNPDEILSRFTVIYN